jgi:hypothetical protein
VVSTNCNFAGGKAGEVARHNADDLPAELCITAFLGRTVNVDNRLCCNIDKSSCFECLIVISVAIYRYAPTPLSTRSGNNLH